MVKIKEIFNLKNISKSRKKILIIVLSIPLPLLLALGAYLLGAQTTTLVAVSAVGVILIFLPLLILSFVEFQEIRNAEKNYPAFLRDLAQSVSSGMTLPQAIDISAENNYGKLSKYIKKLNIYLSWGLPFPEAWKKFTKLLNSSNLMTRLNNLILEAFMTGGDLKTTLNSLGDDVVLLKDMESEKKATMYEQIIIMYVVFFIFLGVIVGVFKILSPILFIQKMGVFSGIEMGSASGSTIGIDYFKNLFFMMALIEGACAGLIAGQISEEKLIAGFKHMVIMVAASLLVFFIFIFPSHLALETSIYPPTIEIGETATISGQVRYEADPLSSHPVDILMPDGTITREYTDSTGTFSKTFKAPDISGVNKFVITVEYEGETKQSELLMKVT